MIPGKRKNFKDLTGQVFGRLTVLEYVGRRNTPSGSFKSDWLCKCECGKEHKVTAARLLSSGIKSCGCLVVDTLRAQSTKHGKHKSPEYGAWGSLLDRCTNPQNKDWRKYGGRGITVSQRWVNSFENFYLDMGDRPTSSHSLDRIDVNGPYSPENCRWATVLEQCNNKTTNVRVQVGDLELTIAEWARKNNISPAAIYARLSKYGWATERAVTTPTRRWSKAASC